MTRNTMRWLRAGVGSAGVVGILAYGGMFAMAQPKPGEDESERKVKEAEVPKAALDALKKMADKAAIKEFSEEIEHGHKYYEGSWVGPHGKVDGLVTEAGDMVELEEKIPAEMAPAAVRDAAAKAAGQDVQVSWEKKTCVMYEIHFKKAGKGHEMMFTPEGRPYHEEGGHDGDEDDKDED